MAYQTGTVNDFVELRTELFNFAQLRGYTLIGGQMLQKGDVYAQIEASTTAYIRMRGGTGQDGSGNPTGAPHARWAYMRNPQFNITFTWPITYHFHHRASPDAVFVALEYNNGWSQHLLFGDMAKAAAFVGGGYYSASVGSYDSGPFPQNPGSLQLLLQSYGGSADGAYEILPFQGGSSGGGGQFAGSYLHAETGGRTWYERTTGVSDTLHQNSLYELRARSLNPWNNGMNLVPWYLFGVNINGNLIVLGELPQMRFCRMRHYNIGDVITIGADKWKLYPVLLKNASQPDPPAGTYHTGDWGIAVAYDGP